MKNIFLINERKQKPNFVLCTINPIYKAAAVCKIIREQNLTFGRKDFDIRKIGRNSE